MSSDKIANEPLLSSLETEASPASPPGLKGSAHHHHHHHRHHHGNHGGGKRKEYLQSGAAFESAGPTPRPDGAVPDDGDDDDPHGMGAGGDDDNKSAGSVDDDALHKQETPLVEQIRTVATVVKSFIGSGVLFLPKAFSNGGWLASIIVMIVMAIVAQKTILLLVECRQRVEGSYSRIGLYAFGRWAKIAVDIALVLSQAGFCTVYVAFIARNGALLLNAMAGRCLVSGSDLWILILLQFFLFTPLTWIRKIRYFGLTSLIANFLIGSGLLGILIWSAVEWGQHPDPLEVPMLNGPGFALFLGAALYAYEGIGMVVPVYDSLSQEGKRRFPWTLSFTLLGIAGVYLIVGLVPYLFVQGKAHVSVQDAITLNLPPVWWAYLIVAAYCLALVFSYPLMLFPVVKILEKSAPSFLALTRGTEFAVRWKRNAFRGLIVLCTLLVAWLGSSQLNNLVALVGAFCCTPLAFIFPAAFHLKLVGREPGASKLTKVMNWAIVVAGLAIFAFSTYEAIASWSISTPHVCTQQQQNATSGSFSLL